MIKLSGYENTCDNPVIMPNFYLRSCHHYSLCTLHNHQICKTLTSKGGRRRRRSRTFLFLRAENLLQTSEISMLLYEIS
ncbi:hypothetical protein RchiOBHm_Chr1g0363571 [Rosa chinensis]|uniref:Uncharacterized protein n=1 Tax=Rosa chinensis TaxID=74649 RepID=A0A2P6SJH2_ROSCH|nr:hypothetical protein RchiOBHm_Chr1g0363571 [Rosa chinensis]